MPFLLLRLDEHEEKGEGHYALKTDTSPIHRVQGIPVCYSWYRTVMEAFGSSMIVLCLLDFCRAVLGIELLLPGKLFYLYKP